MPGMRIAIADDHALFRQGLKSLLRLQPDVTVAAEFERVADILPTLEYTECDVLLLDLQMERAAVADIEALSERLLVIVVTASERPEDAIAALRAGARGVVFKRFAIETLMTAVRTALDGEVWVPPALQAAIAAQLHEPKRVALTRREREIVRNVAMGLRNAEVAQRLHVTEGTVKTHLNNIFQKLGVRDRVQLALYAVRIGLIAPHERRS
jgi:DNA-binding NarL/FixJ family response regulator